MARAASWSGVAPSVLAKNSSFFEVLAASETKEEEEAEREGVRGREVGVRVRALVEGGVRVFDDEVAVAPSMAGGLVRYGELEEEMEERRALVGEEVGVGLRDAGEDRGVGLREVGDDLLLEGAERFAEDTEGREIWGFFVLRSRRKSLKAMARAPTAAVAREAVSIGLAIIEVVAEDMSADVVSFLGANDFFNASTRCFSETFDFDA